MILEFDMHELNLYAEKLYELGMSIDDVIEEFLNTLANQIIRKAQKITPVKTGTLRRSYKVTQVRKVGGYTEITVYNDARQGGPEESYASYVEFGHFTVNRLRWVEGYFMLTLSTQEVERELQRTWDTMVRRAIQRKRLGQ